MKKFFFLLTLVFALFPMFVEAQGRLSVSRVRAAARVRTVTKNVIVVQCQCLLFDLFFGSKGKEVKELQEVLVKERLLQSVNVDSKYGAKTAAAVRRWQEAKDLRPTGIWDKPSRRHLLMNPR